MEFICSFVLLNMLIWQPHLTAYAWTHFPCQNGFRHCSGVYVPEGPERDALTAALAKECYVPVYLDPKIVRVSPACILQVNLNHK